jgi:hypothetical protein
MDPPSQLVPLAELGDEDIVATAKCPRFGEEEIDFDAEEQALTALSFLKARIQRKQRLRLTSKESLCHL